MGFFTKLITSIFAAGAVSALNNSNKKDECKKWNIPIEDLSKQMKDFFGIDLRNAPDYEWKEEDSEYSDSGNLVRHFTLSATHRLSSYFYEAKAIVVGNDTTNFFFKSIYDLETVADLYYLIEREFKKRDITLEDACKEILPEFQTLTCTQFYEFENFSLWFGRDEEDGNIKISIYTGLYNSKYLNKVKAPKVKTKVDTGDGWTLPEGYENWKLRFNIEMAALPFFNECLWMEDGKPKLFGIMEIDGTIGVFDAEASSAVLILEGDDFKKPLDEGKNMFMVCTDVKYEEEFLEVNAWIKISDPEDENDD